MIQCATYAQKLTVGQLSLLYHPFGWTTVCEQAYILLHCHSILECNFVIIALYILLLAGRIYCTFSILQFHCWKHRKVKEWSRPWCM